MDELEVKCIKETQRGPLRGPLKVSSPEDKGSSLESITTLFKSFWWVIHQTFANFDVLAIGVAGAAGASAPAGNFCPGPG